MFYLLIAITGILGLVTISKVTRLLSLVKDLKGDKSSTNWNRVNGILMFLYMLLFLGGTIWEMAYHGQQLLPVSASEHGVLTDNLFNVTFWITVWVFVLTHILLFYFTYRYRGKKEKKAFFYPVNDKLELIWTVIPAIALAVLIIWGWKTWKLVQMTEADNPEVINVYGYQFGWLARYPGPDSTLGPTNYNLISASNFLGLATDKDLAGKIQELEKNISNLKERKQAAEEQIQKFRDQSVSFFAAELDSMHIMLEEIEETLENKELHLQRIHKLPASFTSEANMKASYDDIFSSELVMPAGRPVKLIFGAKDVIHSAYLPFQRVQMNVVPGMPTQFILTPTITTEQMRVELQDPKFDYFLACAKICGSAHYSMKMKVRVLPEEEYQAWLKEQKSYYATQYPSEEKEGLANAKELNSQGFGGTR